MNVRKFFAHLKKRAVEQKLILLAALLAILVTSLIAATILHTVNRLSRGEDGSLIPNIFVSSPRHPLTGEPVETAYAELPQVFGVMVENSADAWPLSGLDEAFLVIEAPVEGNIPRFITFYSAESDVDEIGPVRSARPYYLDWNDELDGVYVHVGGSPEALETIRKDYADYDVNEFFESEYFWRENGTRYAPHNTYTSSDLLKNSLEELMLPEPAYDSWLFKDERPVAADEMAVSITVDWASGYLYDVDWVYDRESNTYIREQNSVEVTMRDRSTISANNVVVMETDVRSVDEVDRKHIRTIGEGDAIIVQDGRVIEGEWKKDSADGRTRFYTNDGEEIAMNPGTTWIEIVDDLTSVTQEQR